MRKFTTGIATYLFLVCFLSNHLSAEISGDTFQSQAEQIYRSYQSSPVPEPQKLEPVGEFYLADPEEVYLMSTTKGASQSVTIWDPQGRTTPPTSNLCTWGYQNMVVDKSASVTIAEASVINSIAFQCYYTGTGGTWTVYLNGNQIGSAANPTSVTSCDAGAESWPLIIMIDDANALNTHWNSGGANTLTVKSSSTIYLSYLGATISYETDLHAEFSLASKKVAVGTEISVNGSASYSDTDQDIVSYSWNFNDGTTVNGVTASHAYTTAGLYTIVLTITDENSKSAARNESIFVYDPGLPKVDMKVATMPSYSQSITYANAVINEPIEAWAKVAGGTAPYFYEIEFGDGTGTSGATNDPSFLGYSHTYTSSGSKYMTLTVIDKSGNSESKEAVIRVYQEATQNIEVNIAIEKALLFLYKNQSASGNWHDTGEYGVAATGLSILAFQENGHLPTNDPEIDVYAQTAKDGLDWLLTQSNNTVTSISTQTDGNPDANGNGKGALLYNNTYANACGLLGIIGGFRSVADAQAYSITSGAFNGMSVYDVICDATDQLYYCQGDGSNKGAWQYSVNTSASGSYDGSAQQWPVLVLKAFEDSWGMTIPSWVRDNIKYAFQKLQNSEGGCGYGSSSSWVNTAKTGGMLVAYSLTGSGLGDSEVDKGYSYLGKYWLNAPDSYGTNGGWGSDLYAMYGIKKGLQLQGVETVILPSKSQRVWYDDLSAWLLGDDTTLPSDYATSYRSDGYAFGQKSDGSWSSSNGYVSSGVGVPTTTAHGILILTNAVTQPLPVAVVSTIGDQPEDTGFQIDGSRSYHMNQDKSLVEWLWDWDADDGLDWNNPDGRGQRPTNSGYASAGTYTITLRVKDDSDSPLYATKTVTVNVTAGNHPPVAVAIPQSQLPSYAGRVGAQIILNASDSYDPDPGDQIVLYEWDTDGDGQYDDGTGVTTNMQFGAKYTGQVGLKVTDNNGAASTNTAYIDIQASYTDTYIDEFSASRILEGMTTVDLHLVFQSDPESQVDVSNALVRFFDENPFTTGNRFGDNYSVNLPVGGSATLDINLTIPTGLNRVYAYLDANQNVVEWDESNNLAYVDILYGYASDDQVTASKNSPITLNVLVNDHREDGYSPSIKSITQPGHGTTQIVNAQEGTILYTPAQDYIGADQFTYTIPTPLSGDDDATVSINVIDNDLPQIVNNTGISVENGLSAAITNARLKATDTETNDAALVFKVITAPVNGSLKKSGSSLVANKTFTQADIDNDLIIYTHSGTATNTDQFTFTVTDGDNASTSVNTFSITIGVTAQPPIVSIPAAQVINEDSELVFSDGNGNRISISDADAGNAPLQLSLNVTNGTVSLSGVAGLTFTNGDGTADANLAFIGTLTNINAALNGLVFGPTLNFHGSASIQISGDDEVAVKKGSKSTDSETISITVNAVNDAPVLDSAPTPALSAINEDNFTSGGNTVAEMVVDGSITDPDGEAVEAIAVVSVDNTNGDWQYSTNGGSSWLPFASQSKGTVSKSKTPTPGLGREKEPQNSVVMGGVVDLLTTARLLDSNHKIRFVPNANYNATANLTFKAWDKTSGAPGGTADASSGGGGSTFSSNSDAAAITVNPIADTPSLTNASTWEDVQTTAGLVISRNVSDGAEVTHFKIISFSGGALFQNDGTSTLAVGDFITFAQGNAGLKFTPAQNAVANGMVTIRAATAANDAGLGGDNASATVTITAVNDEPSFTKGADQDVLEDTGTKTVNGWATNLSRGPADESAQTLVFTVTNDNNDLFAIRPAISASGTLTFTPANNINGSAIVSVVLMDNGGTANGGDDASPTQTFTITITTVNDEPSFTKGADQEVLEDAGAQTINSWATNLSKGPANESGQTLGFIVSSDNNALFTAQPAIDATGKLTYTAAGNANGTATVSVVLKDNGGTANGGDDSSPAQTFTITITNINDEPSFTKGADQEVAEDAGAQTVSGWATNLSRGPANEDGQALSFIVTNKHADLFAVQPALAANGTLTYTPANDANGADTLTVVLKDNGGTANGGDDTYAPQNFIITILSVNDEPSFVKGANQEILEDAGAQAVNNWATNLSKGPADENGQTLAFELSNDANALFAVQPSIDATGKLSYTPKDDANGLAIVTVFLKDNGGIANSGDDTSPAQTFTISVTPVNDVPSFTKGADLQVKEDSGMQTVNGWATNLSKGPADENGQTLTFAVANNNNNLFAIQPAIDANGTLKYTTATATNGAAEVTVTLKDDGGTANGGDDESDAQTFTITVQAVNDAPTIDTVTDQVITEDCPTQMIRLTGLSDGDADLVQNLTVKATSSNIYVIPTPTVVYNQGDTTANLYMTPPKGINGSVVITVTVSDDGGTANGGDNDSWTSFNVAVIPVNDAPSINPVQDVTVLEDAAAQTVNLTGISDGDPDLNQQIEISMTTDNADLFKSLVLQYTPGAAQGAVLFTPEENANGSAAISIKLKDDGGRENGGTDSTLISFQVSVQAVNDTPALTSPLNAQAVEHELFRYTATGEDVEGGQLQFGFLNLPAWLEESKGNTVSGVPAEGCRDTLFQVVVSDGEMRDTATVRITIQSVNDAPYFTSSAAVEATEDILLAYLAAAIDPEDSTLAYKFANLPSWLSQSAANAVSGTPPEGARNTSFRIYCSDGEFSDTLEVAVTVIAVNDPPRITSAGQVEATEDINFSYTLLAQDPDSPNLIYRFESVPGWLTVRETVKLIGRPLEGDPDASFRAIVSDGEFEDTLDVFIAVTAVNDPPVFTSSGLLEATEDIEFVYTVVAVDPEDSTLTYQFSDLPSWLQQTGPGTVKGTPAEGVRDTSFSILVSDGELSTALIVTIKAIAVNDAPYFTSAASIQASENQPFAYTAEAADPEHSTLSYSFSDLASWMSAAGQNVSGTPPEGTRTGTFMAYVSDGEMGDTLQVTVNVQSVNDAPYFTCVGFVEATEDIPFTFTVTAEDLEGATLSYEFSGLPAWLAIEGSNTVAGTPREGQSDTSFTIVVSDGVNSATMTIMINVRPVNDPPVFSEETEQLYALENVNFEFTAHAEDPDNSELTYTFMSLPGWLSINGAGQLSGVPLAGAPNVSFTAIASDGEFSDTLQVKIIIRGQNEALVITSSAVATAVEDETFHYTATANRLNKAAIAYSFVNLSSWLQAAADSVFGTPREGVLNGAFRVIASDGELADTLDVTIQVTPVNDAPVTTPLPRQIIYTYGSFEPILLDRYVSDVDNPDAQMKWTASGSQNLNIVIDDFRRATVTRKVEGWTGTETVTFTVKDPGDSTAQAAGTFTVLAANPPSMDVIGDITIIEDVPKSLFLTGLNPGVTTAAKGLSISAFSFDTDLLPHPQVNYNFPDNVAELRLINTYNQNGETKVRLTMDNGLQENNIFTIDFNVSVIPANDPPTMDNPANQIIEIDADTQYVQITGIGPGAENEYQTLSLSVNSNNHALIEFLRASLNQGATKGLNGTKSNQLGVVKYLPTRGMDGLALITLALSDNEQVNSLTQESFFIAVNALEPWMDPLADITIDEDESLVNVPLTGISGGVWEIVRNMELLFFTNKNELISSTVLDYTYGSSSGNLAIIPRQNKNGKASIAVMLKVTSISGKIKTFTRLFSLNIVPINDPPNLDAIADISILEDAGNSTLTLTGINTGAPNEVQTLTLSAISNNTSLISNPVIDYESGSTNSVLQYAPLKDQNGHVEITVYVNDGGLENNITQRTFAINVQAVNDAPTLDKLYNLPLESSEAARTFSIPLTGISTGAVNEPDLLSITSLSDKPTIIPIPEIVYTSPNATGELKLNIPAGAMGASMITITVNDGQALNQTINRKFSVMISSPQAPSMNSIADLTIDEDAEEQTVNLTGITGGSLAGDIQVIAVCEDTSLICGTRVIYESPREEAVLKFTPQPDQFGKVDLVVTVEQGGFESTEIFGVEVRKVNDMPTLDEINTVTILEDASGYLQTLTGIGSGAPNEYQNLTIKATAANPALFRNLSINYESPTASGGLWMIPAADANGQTEITVSVTDNGDGNMQDKLTKTRTFIAIVEPVNDAPAISMIPDQTTDEFERTGVIHFSVSDIDNDVSALSITAVSGDPAVVPQDSVQITGSGTDCALIICPAYNQFGYVPVSVTVSDGQLSTEESFILTVNRINDPPVVMTSSDSAGVDFDEDGEAAIFLDSLITDPDNEFWELVWQVYILNVQVFGDDGGMSSSIQNGPSVKGHSAAAGKKTGNAVLSQLTLDDYGVEVVVDTVNRKLDVLAPQNFSGLIDVLLTATDPAGLSDSLRLSIRILPVNDPPVFVAAIPDADWNEDQQISLSIANWQSSVFDIDNRFDELTWKIANGKHNTGTISAGKLLITPDRDWNGEDTLKIIVSDGEYEDTTMIKLSVLPVNDAPYDFALLTPADADTFRNQDLRSINFNWEPALDIDGDPVSYTFYLSGPELDTVLVGLEEAELEFDGRNSVFYGETYTWYAEASDGIETVRSLGLSKLVITVPQKFMLSQNYPNPFNPLTTIRYELPQATRVRVDVYNMLGQHLRTLLNTDQRAGYYSVDWDGRNLNGVDMASGVYFLVLRTPEYGKVKKMVLVR